MDSSSRLSGDVDPVGTLGELVVTGSVGGALKTPASVSGPGTLSSLDFDTPYLFAPGSYKVTLSSGVNKTFVLEKGKRTLVSLAQVQTQWNPEKYKIDIGARAFGTISQLGTSLFSNLAMDSFTSTQPVWVFADNSVKFQFTDANMIPDVSEANMAAGKINTIDLNSFPDRRLTIELSAPPRKYLQPAPADTSYQITDYTSLTIVSSDAYSSYDYTRSPLCKARGTAAVSGKSVSYCEKNYTSNFTASRPLFHQAGPGEQRQVSLKGFTLAAGLSYAINTNGMLSLLSKPADSMTLKGHVEPVNVNLVNGITKGFYRIWQIDPRKEGNPNSLFAVGPTYTSCSTYSANGALGLDKYVCGFFQDGLFSTETTIDVPVGFQYLVVTYLRDAAGTLVEQSRHTLDYREL
jgi:hypothetical protein